MGAGDDKFFGDDGGYLNVVYGGAGDDKALGGDNWGTDDAPRGTLPANIMMFANGMQVLTGGDAPLNFDTNIPVETAASAAVADGDDFLDLGDGNYANYAFGNGGNDKIIGGGLFEDEQALYGGDGDDKIFAINPSQRGTAADVLAATVADPAAQAFGGLGNDEIHGADWDETIYGDAGYGETESAADY